MRTAPIVAEAVHVASGATIPRKTENVVSIRMCSRNLHFGLVCLTIIIGATSILATFVYPRVKTSIPECEPVMGSLVLAIPDGHEREANETAIMIIFCPYERHGSTSSINTRPTCCILEAVPFYNTRPFAVVVRGMPRPA